MKVIIFDTVYNEKRVLKKKQKNYIPRIGEYVIAFPYEYKAKVTNVIYEYDKK